MKKNRYRYYLPIIAIFLVAVSSMALVISGCGLSEKNKQAGRKGMYYCPMHPAYTSDRQGDCPICNMRLVKKEEKAEEKTLGEVCIEHKCAMNDCPMSVKAGIKPGERIICPICGEVMSTGSGKVVEISKQPVREDGSTAGPTVLISAEKQQLIGVKTGQVGKRALIKMIRVSGKIAYDPELAITQEEFAQALNAEDNVKDSPLQDVIDRARRLTKAARNKLKLLGMNDDQIVILEKTRKAETNLYLPGKGENIWAYISVYEYEIGSIKVGDSVEIEAVAYPGERFTGNVVSINPVLDPNTRTNQVRVEVVNTGDKLKPEMFVNANIKVDLGHKLAVPEAAIMDTGLRKIVYLSREGDVLESREVSIGQKAEGYYEVMGGLKEGDIVVISGNFLVDSESKLKSAVSGQSHQHGQ